MKHRTIFPENAFNANQKLKFTVKFYVELGYNGY